MKIDIIAHRGASHDAPENTLAAFNRAWQQDADGIELDVRLTADNQIVCLHDATTERVGNRILTASDATAEKLRQVDVGSWKGSQWTGEHIPLLAEVLHSIPRGKRIYIEIKSGPEIVPLLEKELIVSGLLPEQTVVIAFDERVVTAVKRQMPWLKVFWLTETGLDEQTGAVVPAARNILATLDRVQADGVDLAAHAKIDRAFVDLLCKNGKEVHVWNIKTPEMAMHFRALGADSLTTDFPGWIKQRLADSAAADAA